MRQVPNGKGLKEYIKWLKRHGQAIELVPGKMATVYSKPKVTLRELREGLKRTIRHDCTVLSKSTTGKRMHKSHGYNICDDLKPVENGRFAVISKNLTVISFKSKVQALTYIALMNTVYPKAVLSMRDRGPDFEHTSILEYTF